MASTSVVLPWSTWAMMATFLRFGFAITIRTVYRTSYSTSASGCGARPSPGSGRASPRALALKVSKGELSQARQQIARAGAELLVVGDLLGVGPRVSGTGEVVVRHCRVEPRGRHPAAAGCDGLLALGDLARLARGRVVAATDLVEFGEHVRLGVLQAARGARDDLDRARPLLPFGQHQAEVVARFAVAVVAFQGFVEFGARDFELLSKVRDDAGQLRHLGVDEQFGGELDVGPGSFVAPETRFMARRPVAAVADMPRSARSSSTAAMASSWRARNVRARTFPRSASTALASCVSVSLYMVKARSNSSAVIATLAIDRVSVGHAGCH